MTTASSPSKSTFFARLGYTMASPGPMTALGCFMKSIGSAGALTLHSLMCET
jgi:hypothetical protein